jgi:hypothetical protein
VSSSIISMLLPFLPPRGHKPRHAAINACLHRAQYAPLHDISKQKVEVSASVRTGRILELSIVHCVDARNTSIQPPDGLSTTG